jgi:hypothetical protein
VGIVLAFNLFLIATCGYAISRGGPPERWAGVALLVAAACTILVHMPRTDTHFRSLEAGLIVIDGALLAALAAIAIRANRYWPLWMTAIHATAVAVHIAKAVNPSIVWPIYATAASVSSIPIQILLAWGTFRHRRRLERNGTDPPWRSSSRW